MERYRYTIDIRGVSFDIIIIQLRPGSLHTRLIIFRIIRWIFDCLILLYLELCKQLVYYFKYLPNRIVVALVIYFVRLAF